MAFTPKNWLNENEAKTTPLNAAGLKDIETRLAAYADSLISALSVGTSALANLAVTTAKLGEEAVTAAKIAAGTITEEKLATAVKNKLKSPVRTSHTWTFNGAVEAKNYGGFYVSINSEETVKLIGMKYKIAEGTNCKIRILKNGSEIASYKEKEVTTTAGEVSAEVSLASGDRLELLVESISGTPKTPIITVFLEHTH